MSYDSAIDLTMLRRPRRLRQNPKIRELTAETLSLIHI